jgi:uncharacterized protein YqeY
MFYQGKIKNNIIYIGQDKIMETLKQKIQADFVTAMKNKDNIAKSALSGIKSKITEAEKLKGNIDLTDDDVIKVITTGIKQRKQSVDEFTKGNRTDLVEKEQGEISVLERYLSKQMSEEQIEQEIRIMVKFSSDYIGESAQQPINKQKLIGQTMGAFNKKYPGRADNALTKKIIEKLVGEIV